jgi:hypothetical protein
VKHFVARHRNELGAYWSHPLDHSQAQAGNPHTKNPSHSTHLFQGLDVMIFGVLKWCWSKARDTFEREHGVIVMKKNFMKVYARAHLKALTKENILAVFQKTEIALFIPNVITEEMLAPSQTSSIEGPLPLPTEEPTTILTNMIHRVVACQAIGDANSLGTDTTLAETNTRTMLQY